ncbi:MAG: AAA-like domain-containing protein [Woeseia sp.]
MSSEKHSTGSLDDTGEFFSVGAPLHAVRPGYVRRPADDALFETLVSGGFAQVIAPDRTGKSSLVAATSARLQNNGFKVAVIDLEQISERDGGADAGRWFYSVAYRLLRQLRLKIDLQSWWQDKSFLSNRQRLVEFYVEVILQHISERIVIFIDEVQCVTELPFAAQLLASVRAAHNARTTEPDSSRLSFVLIGECDPMNLVEDANLSPFTVAQAIQLTDFTRTDLDLFANELNLSTADARTALDRIFYWTDGQPYLSQKLARSVARERISGNIESHVDRIAMQRLAGRAALHSEPHMGHIHRQVTADRKHGEALLNLYGRIRKGIATDADLASPVQRRLIAVGLIVADDNAQLRIRNRLYETVFTARWANENIPLHWRGPAIAVATILAFIAIPFLYTQILPRPYLRVMSSPTVEIDTAAAAYRNLRSFPGHVESAERLMRIFLQNRAIATEDRAAMMEIDRIARRLPGAEEFADNLLAGYWDRRVAGAARDEHRDQALLAALESLIVSTPARRRRAATLVGDDYTHLVATHVGHDADHAAFSPEQLLLTYADGPVISQWSLANDGLVPRDPWTMSALEVTPLVRRVVVDRDGSVDRIGLTVNVSHARLDDLRLKLIAPSGRAVDLTFTQSQSAANDVIRFSRPDLAALIGESLNGTWSLSVRDENTGATGHLITWNLNLNSQVVVENFERGLDIPEPVVRESDDLWFSPDGRYAIARAMQSDSARLWDLAFAQPARTLPVPANERVLGLSANARYLVTVTQDTANLWDTSSGRLHARLAIGAASADARVSDSGEYLLIRRRGEADTEFELWSLESGNVRSRLSVAGSPALFAIDAHGARLAVADYDRTVRIWDFADGALVAQLDFWAQPSEIRLAPGGDALGVVHGNQGISMWRVGQPDTPLVFERGANDWQMTFSPSGSKLLAGSARQGFQVFRSSDGAMSGPPLGAGQPRDRTNILVFSGDEQLVVTGDAAANVRFWAAPRTIDENLASDTSPGHRLWRESGDSVTAISPGGSHIAIGDGVGHVHVLQVNAGAEALAAASDELSFLGHQGAVVGLAFSQDGALVASVGLDRSIRIWDTSSGLPRPYHVRISANAIAQLAFSPSAGRLAVLGGQRLWVINTDSGAMLANVELGEPHAAVVFPTDEQLYVGGESGILRSVTSDRTGSWHLRNVWQGSSAVRSLGMSPNGQQIIIVDAQHVALSLNIASGAIGTARLTLPDTVTDIVFGPSESRAIIRTGRWIHRAGVSPGGLIWLDAIRAPKALAGSQTVQVGDPFGDRVLLLTRDAGFPEVAELRFSYSMGPALFGNKDELLAEWREKLGIEVPAPADLVRSLHETTRDH